MIASRRSLASLLVLVPALACAPAVDEDGFSTDVAVAIAARGHDFGCFDGDVVYELQLAVDGEGEDAENLAALIQEGPENFVTGTWSYEVGVGGDETLAVTAGDLSFASTDLEKKFGALVSFPAGSASCRVRGFLPGGDTLAGGYVCEDPFWDSVTFTFAADGSLAVRSVRDDDGAVTDQDDYGAYFIEGGELFVLRPERDEPEVRFMRGSPGAGAIDLGAGSCPSIP